MGLGPSYQPNCRHCKGDNVLDGSNDCKVTHILLSKGRIPELHSWWISDNLSNGESLYYACRKCIKDIDESYKFEYRENYTVRSS